VPNERIVQGLAGGKLGSGRLLDAKFDLVEQGSEPSSSLTILAFPGAVAEELAAGWKANYWERWRNCWLRRCEVAQFCRLAADPSLMKDRRGAHSSVTA